MKEVGYYNGTIGPLAEMTVPIFDRALYFGDGIYEATCVANRIPFALDDHLDRMYNSLRLLEIPQAVKAAEANGATYHVGNVNSSDVFYGDHIGVPEGLDSVYGLKKMGVLALEMEAAALYMNAARYGKRGLCICTISDHVLKGVETTSEERQNSFTTMMKVALDVAVAMENK